MYIKINNGVITAPDDIDVDALIYELTDVIEKHGAEWCVGFSYGQDVQKEYGDG